MTNSLPRNGSLNVVFPTQWIRDLSTNNPIPIDGSLTCTIQNFTNLSYLSSLICFGSYSNKAVTINPIFLTTSTQL